jgi:indole-3-glycerol phosphate synthase
MDILEKIKIAKLAEIEERKNLYPIKLLERSQFFDSPCVAMTNYITDPKRSGIIAEFKRKSPSKGNINIFADAREISLNYMQSGASALSVLTDEKFFGAKESDFKDVRLFNFCPILRKDFILDEYQIVESKSMGADVILLIGRLLTKSAIQKFTKIAHALGMQVLLELHFEEEILEFGDCDVDLFGINNRNLASFEVNIAQSIDLCAKLPQNSIKIAESGIHSPETIKELRQNGFQGFLIGEYFMKSSNPGERCKTLVQSLK